MSRINVWLRAKQKIIITVVCCVLMVTFVMGGALFNLFTPSPVPGGSIFDRKVDGTKVYDLARRLSLFTGGRRTNDEELIAMAWEVLIYEHEARRYGIRISNADVTQALAQVFPAKEGGLDELAYNTRLKDRGITGTDYETTLRKILATQKVRQLVQNAVTLPPEEAWLWYSKEKEKVQTRYVQIVGKDLAPLVKPDEQELKAFYEEHRDTPKGQGPYGSGYLQPERVKIEYVLARRTKFEKDMKVSEDEIKEYYEKNRDKYKKPPKKDAKEDKATQDADKDKAKEAQEKPEYRPLADVRKSIERRLKSDKASDKVGEVMKEVNEAVYKALDGDFGSEEEPTVDLPAIAKQFGLEHRVTDFFSADDVNRIIPGARELKEKAFGRNTRSVGTPSPVLDASIGKFVYKTIAVKRPAPAPFDDVKAEVAGHVSLKKGSDLAVEIAGKATEAKNIDEVAEVVQSALTEIIKTAPQSALQMVVKKGDGKEAEVKKKQAGDFFKTGESAFFERPKVYGQYRFHRGAGLPGKFDTANYAEVAFSLKEGEIGMAVDSDEEVKAVLRMQRTGYEPARREDFDKEKEFHSFASLRKAARGTGVVEAGPSAAARVRQPM